MSRFVAVFYSISGVLNSVTGIFYIPDGVPNSVTDVFYTFDGVPNSVVAVFYIPDGVLNDTIDVFYTFGGVLNSVAEVPNSVTGVFYIVGTVLSRSDNGSNQDLLKKRDSLPACLYTFYETLYSKIRIMSSKSFSFIIKSSVVFILSNFMVHSFVFVSLVSKSFTI